MSVVDLNPGQPGPLEHPSKSSTRTSFKEARCGNRRASQVDDTDGRPHQKRGRSPVVAFLPLSIVMLTIRFVWGAL